jgi:hypothetical protein
MSSSGSSSVTTITFIVEAVVGIVVGGAVVVVVGAVVVHSGAQREPHWRTLGEKHCATSGSEWTSPSLQDEFFHFPLTQSLKDWQSRGMIAPERQQSAAHGEPQGSVFFETH